MKGWGLMGLIKDWSIEYIFFEHRYPVLFLSSFKDELFLCCRSDDESCVLTKTTIDQCRKMLANELTIRETFAESENPIFLEEQRQDRPVYTMIGPQHSALPTQGVYFDADLEEVEEFERLCERWERDNGERDYFCNGCTMSGCCDEWEVSVCCSPHDHDPMDI